MKKISFILLVSIVWMCQPLQSAGQEYVDSDSIIKTLQAQLQEMQLNDLLLREQLERNGQTLRNDSVRKSKLKMRIDSLRSITAGAPLVIVGCLLYRCFCINLRFLRYGLFFYGF